MSWLDSISDGSMWDGLVDGGGELINGAVDSANEYAGGWIDNKIKGEAKAVSSANPEENRTVPAAQVATQPNGAPIFEPVADPMVMVKTYAPFVVGGLAVIALSIYAIKG